MNAWRFEREVEEVFSTVRKAQALALTYQTDIAITFWATRSSFHMQSSSAEPFPRFLFDKSKRALPHIGRIAGSGGKEVQKLKLRIYGDGSIEPRTHLAFSPRGSLEPSHTLDVTTGFLIKTL